MGSAAVNAAKAVARPFLSTTSELMSARPTTISTDLPISANRTPKVTVAITGDTATITLPTVYKAAHTAITRRWPSLTPSVPARKITSNAATEGTCRSRDV